MDAFRERLADTHVRCATSARRWAFGARFSRTRFGGLALVEASVPPCRVRRGRRELAEQDGGVFGVQVVLRGHELIGPDRHSLGPGGLLVWDAARPVDVDVVEPLVKRTLVMPRDEALAACPGLSGLAGVPLAADNPSARLFASYLAALARELPALDEEGRRAASRAALELVRAVVPGAAQADGLRERVHAYIEEHLDDPRLTPASIAAAHAVSVRRLHGLFHQAPEGVAARIRRRRLERCRAELAQDADAVITRVALRWGFQDPAHFSRTFRRHFGQTPSAVRDRIAGD